MSNQTLVNDLVRDGYLRTSSVIKAFRKIDRIDFVPENLKGVAYANEPLPIGQNQTISQPLTVAFMLELLEPGEGDRILDVGSGSGWQASLLAEIVGKSGRIVAIEKILQLKALAEGNINKYNFIKKGTVKIFWEDGSKGYLPDAPYDKIIAAAAAESIPEAWKKQLKAGGRIVAPVKNSIVVLDKMSEEEFKEKEYFGFSFVPLIID